MAAVTTVAAGAKRKAPDIGDQERLAKRFEVLNLSLFPPPRARPITTAHNGVAGANGHRHYLPVASEQQQAAHRTDSSALLPPSPPATAATAPPSDGMHVEDTPHRVYIHDLDAELADLSSSSDDDGRPVFIPDIDKHLSKFPQRLLRGHADPAVAGAHDKQLVLYSVPNSISVPHEDDSVHKVLVESHNRARLEQRARIKKEMRGEMEVEDAAPAEAAAADEGDRPRRVFARLKWKDAPHEEDATPQVMSMEDAEETTPEPGGPAGAESDDDDAMDLG